MKKYLIFVVGFILGIMGTSYAAYKLKAEQVSFNNKLLESNDVQSAIDEISYLIKDQIGNNDISDIGDGTITGAIKTINEQKNEQNIYSTKEHAIGTWIDGSTIYEKTYKLTGTDKMGYSGNLVRNVLETNSNIKHVIDYTGYFYSVNTTTGEETSLTLNHVNLISNITVMPIYIKNNSQLSLFLGSTRESGYLKDIEIIISIQYTKK